MGLVSWRSATIVRWFRISRGSSFHLIRDGSTSEFQAAVVAQEFVLTGEAVKDKGVLKASLNSWTFASRTFHGIGILSISRSQCREEDVYALKLVNLLSCHP